MQSFETLFGLQDLTGTFTVADIVASLIVSFVLSSIVGVLYQKTHRGTSYTQGYVQTLVVVSMVVSVIMLIVGSNIARAFTLVGALSVVRFRNAIKDTRDVGFIFFVLAIGMASGTRFYLLAIIATAVVGFVILCMDHFNWYARSTSSQLLKIQVPAKMNFEKLFDSILSKYTTASDLISVDAVRAGSLTELVYVVQLKKRADKQAFIAELKKLNADQAVSILTGYNAVDL